MTTSRRNARTEIEGSSNFRVCSRPPSLLWSGRPAGRTRLHLIKLSRQRRSPLIHVNVVNCPLPTASIHERVRPASFPLARLKVFVNQVYYVALLFPAAGPRRDLGGARIQEPTADGQVWRAIASKLRYRNMIRFSRPHGARVKNSCRSPRKVVLLNLVPGEDSTA